MKYRPYIFDKFIIEQTPEFGYSVKISLIWRHMFFGISYFRPKIFGLYYNFYNQGTFVLSRYGDGQASVDIEVILRAIQEFKEQHFVNDILDAKTLVF